MSEEEWRSIPGFPGYQVSSLGRVQSFKNGDIFGRLLKPSTGNAHGRALVALYVNGRRVDRLVSRLVCEAFHGAPQKGQMATHIDGNRFRDHANNLRWGSALENTDDRDRHGMTARGSRHYAAKLTEAQVSAIRAAYREAKGRGRVYGFVTDAARRYGVKIGCVEDVVYGRKWRHVQ